MSSKIMKGVFFCRFLHEGSENTLAADVPDLGPGTVDCMVLHKKGLYVAGQVSSKHKDFFSSSCSRSKHLQARGFTIILYKINTSFHLLSRP